VSAELLKDRPLILAATGDVFVGHHQYHHAPLDRVLAGAIDHPRLPRTRPLPPAAIAVPALRPPTPPSGPLTMADVIDALNAFLDERPQVPLVADTGDALFASVDIRSNECLAPAYYATMGFAIPAALGLQIASGRRPLVLVGDGAFQMTGPEISRAPEYGCSPIVVVLNNGSWEMLQAFFPEARYNSTAPWPFAKLGELWGGWGTTASSAAALRDALDAAWQETRFSVIEVPLAAGDISPVLRQFVEAFKQQTAGAEG
jgi:indolepyruvate decarboxylase